MTDDRDPFKRRSPSAPDDARSRVRASSASEAAKDRSRAPDFVSEEVTGVHVGEELRARRGKRDTGERLTRLEDKHDVLASKVDEHRDAADRRHDSLVRTVGTIRESVGEVIGKLEVLPELVGIVRDVAKHSATREHITLTAKVDVDKALALDQIDAKKTQRMRVTTIIGGAITLVTSGAFVHWLLGRI